MSVQYDPLSSANTGQDWQRFNVKTPAPQPPLWTASAPQPLIPQQGAPAIPQQAQPQPFNFAVQPPTQGAAPWMTNIGSWFSQHLINQYNQNRYWQSSPRSAPGYTYGMPQFTPNYQYQAPTPPMASYYQSNQPMQYWQSPGYHLGNMQGSQAQPLQSVPPQATFYSGQQPQAVGQGIPQGFQYNVPSNVPSNASKQQVLSNVPYGPPQPKTAPVNLQYQPTQPPVNLQYQGGTRPPIANLQYQQSAPANNPYPGRYDMPTQRAIADTMRPPGTPTVKGEEQRFNVATGANAAVVMAGLQTPQPFDWAAYYRRYGYGGGGGGGWGYSSGAANWYNKLLSWRI